jgi:hypothetical protein
MPSAKDRIFISIGVSRPGGGLQELPGAINAATRMAAWAVAQGYETLLIHDAEIKEITVDLLRTKITSVIESVTQHSELKRLVVFFAGHGAALDLGDQYWILTNWKSDWTEAIKVSSLQRVLEYYGPKQVAIIGDACQEFSAKFSKLVGSQILATPNEDIRDYELDHFLAVDVGMQAFMIKAKDNTEDFCIFTEVMLEGLQGGARDKVYARVGEQVVTSQSLAQYLKINVALVASKHGVNMTPFLRPGFFVDPIYLTLPPGGDLPTGYPHQDDMQFGEPPAPSGHIVVRDAGGKRSGDYISRLNIPPIVELIRADITDVESPSKEIVDAEREASRRGFVEDLRESEGFNERPFADSAIHIYGIRVTELVASFASILFGVHPAIRQHVGLQIHGRNQKAIGWTDVIVSFADGRVISACALDGFSTAVQRMRDSSISVFHRPLRGNGDIGYKAIDLLARAHAGLLDREAIIDSAAMIRNGKHEILTFGCIAAQFYDVIRDVESLRSMAAFYAMNYQPVPLDIILYGGGAISESDGRLYADIPEVPRRQPRTELEQKQRFTFRGTPAFEKHPIAGRIPWMRQAWGAVATAACQESAKEWRKDALVAMKYLDAGLFTVVRSEGHAALLALAGIAKKNSNAS